MKSEGPPRFELGEVICNPEALAACEDESVDIFKLLRRHDSGDWGDVTESDAHGNEAALMAGAVVVSIYELLAGAIAVLTEAAGEDGVRPVTSVFFVPDFQATAGPSARIRRACP